MNLPPSLILLPLLLHTSLLSANPENLLQPYHGPSIKGVDTTTLTGKVMAGYQGWFNTPDDGAGLGWTHWARKASQPFGPDNVGVELWPDVSEASPSELVATEFKLANGDPAMVFSSHNRTTVLRHFQWMHEHEIDGVFVQRFANGLRNESLRNHKDKVLSSCREGANREGRTYALMYDLSGLKSGETTSVSEDWTMLQKRMHMGKDPAYLHHEGKPLVAIWGIGFNDGRKYSLAECRTLIEFFKAQGCAVMLGVPSFWREQTRDATSDPDLHNILTLADIISPWTPGRYRTPEEATRHAQTIYPKDIAWCEQRDLDFLPVCFPGFSWKNMKPDAPFNAIPRLKGEFLWSQFIGAKEAGAKMIYVAMFDEVDEGTAIFKCTNHPPVGPTPFLTYEGLPSDHYLWLTGQGGKMLRGDGKFTTFPPPRPECSNEE